MACQFPVLGPHLVPFGLAGPINKLSIVLSNAAPGIDSEPESIVVLLL